MVKTHLKNCRIRFWIFTKNRISSSSSHTQTAHQISSGSVKNFLRYPAHRQTNKQTNRQTERGENITSFTFGGGGNKRLAGSDGTNVFETVITNHAGHSIRSNGAASNQVRVQLRNWISNKNIFCLASEESYGFMMPCRRSFCSSPIFFPMLLWLSQQGCEIVKTNTCCFIWMSSPIRILMKANLITKWDKILAFGQKMSIGIGFCIRICGSWKSSCKADIFFLQQMIARRKKNTTLCSHWKDGISPSWRIWWYIQHSNRFHVNPQIYTQDRLQWV